MAYPDTTTTRSGLGRPLVVGSLLALAVIAALVVWAFAGGGLQQSGADESDVIVVLVLPDEEGTLIPRTITRVVANGAAAAAAAEPVSHPDPRAPATIPGTTYNELRDAYPFGGGSLLARILTETTATPGGGSATGGSGAHPAHVVVDLEALRTLTAGSSATLDLDLPDHMEVFDGERLFSFAQGPATVALDDLPALFAGAEYLSAEQRTAVRVQAGEALLGLLRDGGAQLHDAVETDLSADRYATFASSLPAS